MPTDAPDLALEHSYAALPPAFWREVAPTPVAAPRLLAWNAPLAAELGLPPGLEARAAEWFSGNRPPPGARPIATAYAGHQFAQFVPQLGDGRAILLGEWTTPDGRRVDLQLKGAGPTPFSRNGDGRAAMGPVLREYLVSEAMHALGIPTTRALAAVATGEAVWREAPLPGAVLTRVAASHLRVGTFEYFAAREDRDGLRRLADFAIARHVPEAAGAARPALALLSEVAARQALLVARWQQVGFIHGVMNTDNMAISGETLDYGPCAFLDAYEPGKAFSAIDRRGRYAWDRQPAIAQWNLARLAECLLPLIDHDPSRALEAARGVIDAFPGEYARHWRTGFAAKLGLDGAQAGDEALIVAFLQQLQRHGTDFTLGFRALSAWLDEDGSDGDDATAGVLPADADFAAWEADWRRRLQDGDGLAAARQRLRDANPAVIPRNHRVEAALAAAAGGDLAPFEALLAAVRRPYNDGPAQRPFMAPPAEGEQVLQTFCGT